MYDVVYSNGEEVSRSQRTKHSNAVEKQAEMGHGGLRPKDGRRCHKWLNGDQYDGDWSGSDRHGKGTFTWANGNQYVGEWLKDNLHGKGAFRYANGEKYDGEWKED